MGQCSFDVNRYVCPTIEYTHRVHAIYKHSALCRGGWQIYIYLVRVNRVHVRLCLGLWSFLYILTWRLPTARHAATRIRCRNLLGRRGISEQEVRGGGQRRHGDHVLNRWEGRRLCYIIDGSDNIRRPLQLLLNNAHNPPGQPNTHAHSLALQLANLELRLTYKKSL